MFYSVLRSSKSGSTPGIVGLDSNLRLKAAEVVENEK
jgi:hypothetical protein